jgi:hypothetical protein
MVLGSRYCADDQESLTQLCTEKDFLFRRNIASKLHNAPLGGQREQSLCNSVQVGMQQSTTAATNVIRLQLQKEIAIMNRKARTQQHVDYMNRISAVGWFAGAVRKLQEVMKRSATPIPTGCFQFLTVLKYLFMFGFQFDSEDLFYKVTGPIFTPEDYSKLVGGSKFHFGVRVEE